MTPNRGAMLNGTQGEVVASHGMDGQHVAAIDWRVLHALEAVAHVEAGLEVHDAIVRRFADAEQWLRASNSRRSNIALSCRPSAIAKERRMSWHEQEVELRGSTVEWSATQAHDIGETEAVIAEEAHHAFDFGAADDGRDRARLDHQRIDFRQSTGHAGKHHQLGALDVDLAQCRSRDLGEQAVEATQRHAVHASHAARADFVEQSRFLDIRANLELGFAIMITQG